MAQQYFRNAAKCLAVFCILLSMLSESFYFVGGIALAIAGCFFVMGHAETLEYDRERHYAIFAFDDKAEFFCNLGLIGLIFLTVVLIDQFCLSSFKTALWANWVLR